MNLKDILELEEFKNTLIGNALRWWITERLDRKIEDVMWWNAKEHTVVIGNTEHIELSACFKDGTPFVQTFQKEELREKVRATHDVEEQDTPIMIPVHSWIWKDFKTVYPHRTKTKFDTDEELDKKLIEIAHDWACRAMQYYTRYNMEDPWTLVDAYEIALKCPDIELRECDVPKGAPKAWTITTPYRPDVQAEGPNDLYRKLKVAKEYAETLKKSKKEQSKQRVPKMPEAVIYPYDPGRTLVEKSRRNVIREAYEIAETCPAMIIEELKHGWSISFEDDDYSVEALDAVHLLAEVKEAKAYWEASQKSKKTSTEQTRDMIREAMEKAKNSDGEVIRVDGLDRETKELLLHFIESLTIKEASDILAKEYPCSVWDELHFIREKLRKSIAQPRRER